MTKVAGADVVFNKAGDVGPVKIAREQFESLETTKMAGCRMIVDLGQDGGLEVLVVWNINKAVVEDEAVGVEGEGLKLREAVWRAVTFWVVEKREEFGGDGIL